MEKKKVTKKYRRRQTIFWGFIGCLLFLGFIATTSSAYFKWPKPQTEGQSVVNTTPTPTILSTVTPNVKRDTTTKIQPVVDNDPIIDCVSSHPHCNGESVRLKRSQCSKIYCCGLNNGRWILYPSEEKCKEEANKGVPIQQTTQSNTYCWNNAYNYGYYTTSGEQCNLNNSKSSAYKTCMDTQMSKNNSCKSSCKNEKEKNDAICAWAYTGSNPGIELNADKYSECLLGPDGTSESYGTCLGKCGDQYSQDLKQCSL